MVITVNLYYKAIASKTIIWKVGKRFTSSTCVIEPKKYFAEGIK